MKRRLSALVLAAAAAGIAGMLARSGESSPGAAHVAPPMAQYPGDVRMPLLNGVRVPVRIDWPPSEPWSPIVGKVTADGVEWYRHADGRLSTTLEMEDSVAGHTVGMGLTASIEPVADRLR